MLMIMVFIVNSAQQKQLKAPKRCTNSFHIANTSFCSVQLYIFKGCLFCVLVWPTSGSVWRWTCDETPSVAILLVHTHDRHLRSPFHRLSYWKSPLYHDHQQWIHHPYLSHYITKRFYCIKMLLSTHNTYCF